MKTETVIRQVYRRMGSNLSMRRRSSILPSGYLALSQYGYVLSGPHKTMREAECAVIAHYTADPRRWLCLVQGMFEAEPPFPSADQVTA